MVWCIRPDGNDRVVIPGNSQAARQDGRQKITRTSKLIPVQQVAQSTQDTAFFSPAPKLGAVLNNAAGQPADWQGLQPYFPRSAHCSEKQSFAPKHPVA